MEVVRASGALMCRFVESGRCTKDGKAAEVGWEGPRHHTMWQKRVNYDTL